MVDGRRPDYGRCARVMALALVTTACGSSSEPSALYGSYALRMVDGAPPPVAILVKPDETIVATGGSLILRSDKTYTLTEEQRFYTAVDTVDSPTIENGTFTISGATLLFFSNAPLVPGRADHEMQHAGPQILFSDVFLDTTATYVYSR